MFKAQSNQQISGLDQSNIFAERIAYEYQLKQYEDLLSRWNSKAKIYCDKVRVKFNSLLKFPFGGWMIDVQQTESSDDISEDEDEEEQNINDSDTEMRMAEETNDSAKQVSETRLRQRQIKSLRRLYLPNICFVLTDMLAKMKLHKDLIRVSDIIASEQYKLYALFESKQLKCFLNKVADASICLLDEGCDFLGY